MAWHMLTLNAPCALPESVAEVLRDAGTMGIWELTAHEWRASFKERPSGLEDALTGCGVPLRATWALDEGTDWTARYQQSLKPLALGRRFTVLPSPDLANPWPGRLPLKLFPGMAFGTGEHYTTSSSLRILESLEPFPSSVLDVGCGTGILSVAASVLGATEVIACDVDRDACRVSAETGDINCARYRIVQGSASAVSGRFDLVIANILTEVLLEIMGDLVDRVGRGGWLVCSGILCTKGAEILDATRQRGLATVERRSDGDWWTFLFHRPA